MKRQVLLALSVVALLSVSVAYYRFRGQGRSGSGRPRPPISGAEDPRPPSDVDDRIRDWRTIEGFDQPIAQFETVFWEPADTDSLRRLIRESALVQDKTILEIGTGTGLISLVCLQAGAAQVVATDVNPAAIANATFNAQRLGLGDRLETRLVPRDRPAAYAVIGDSERFDLIISNPPWENHKPATIAEYAFYDENFELMRTLLEGLQQHLTTGGKSMLAYGVVDAIKTLQQIAPQHNLGVRVLDDRDLDELPEEFLPGMLLEVTPLSASGR